MLVFLWAQTAAKAVDGEIRHLALNDSNNGNNHDNNNNKTNSNSNNLNNSNSSISKMEAIYLLLIATLVMWP